MHLKDRLSKNWGKPRPFPEPEETKKDLSEYVYRVSFWFQIAVLVVVIVRIIMLC